MATAKQIEAEFQHTTSSKMWRWSARNIAKNKFTMRFPDAQMVQVYSNFKSLGLRDADAKIMVEPWSSSAGAKGELQHSWFRVKGIPVDQRSVKTIAKIGGLVGKVLAIDEKYRFRTDYVRINLSCRDITQVPAVAESTLGLKIYDFFFEREVHGENATDPLRGGEMIGDPSNQSQHKNPRMDPGTNLDGAGYSGGTKSGMASWARKPYAGSQSAPSKRALSPKALEWLQDKDKNLKIDSGKGASKEDDLGDISWGNSDDYNDSSLNTGGGNQLSAN